MGVGIGQRKGQQLHNKKGLLTVSVLSQQAHGAGAA